MGRTGSHEHKGEEKGMERRGRTEERQHLDLVSLEGRGVRRGSAKGEGDDERT
jgi:hypothetical protein